MQRSLADTPESWPVSKRVDLFRDDWVMALRSDTLTRPGHDRPFERLVFEHPGAVAVLAVDGSSGADHVLILRQYRHPVQRRLVEIPAGLLDVETETELGAAQRELREEAQLAARRWSVLVDVLSSPGISTEAVRIYLAEDLYTAEEDGFEPCHEEAEMTREWVGLADLVDAILAGSVRDSLAVAGALALWARRHGAQSPPDPAST
ncbi:MAG: NUDIX domain-containing protein [Nocardioidaceae bacterium]